MKVVLGLDLGTASIGWALVNQAESESEKSSIIKAGVRVNPLSSDEKAEFEQGKDSTTNAGRRLKRGMRRNTQRRKLRRENLIEILRQEGWITDDSSLAESGEGSTYETYRLRAEAARKEVSLEALARILLMINKKRGYKSNRKDRNQESESNIGGMEVAKELTERNMTPGQYCHEIIVNGGKDFPDFFRSDLKAELDKIWDFQKTWHPDILTDEIKAKIIGKSKSLTARVFKDSFNILPADIKGNGRKTEPYMWRNKALREKLTEEELVYVIADLAGKINEASGLLGAISDRSKELSFNGETVGEHIWKQLCTSPLSSLKNQAYYRQDYIDEFETIWETQSKYHPQLTEDLKKKIRDTIIFYQRRLKSQKGLVGECEFEKHHKVAPKSSLLFQEFKIRQILNNVLTTDTETGEQRPLDAVERETLAGELFLHNKLAAKDAAKMLFPKRSKHIEFNYKDLEGNTTAAKIAETLKKAAGEKVADSILAEYDSSLPKEQYESLRLYRIWHLLYSYEGDSSRTGDESLIRKLAEICGISEESAKALSRITFTPDYGSLSSRAIRKILPYLKQGLRYDQACKEAGYNHSHSVSKDEERTFAELLDPIKKNSLRNPVVEKILNQMVNVVNMISATYGKPDEIHIEMARELKQSKDKRAKAYEDINANNKKNEEIKKILETEFGISSVRKTDIVRYKLYEELKGRGYKTLYSNKYISHEQLFSKEIDIEHIIPQSVLFDDSFANKTLEFRAVNIEKGDSTAYDYVAGKYGEEGLERFKADIDAMLKEGKIGRKKAKNLLMKASEIPSDFLERDLKNTQYIAKKATEMLQELVPTVVTTTGEITKRLREDWQLVDVMKELNLPKYSAAGLTYSETDNDGRRIPKIQDWTKRNDHRHHTMDALTIAFTKPSHIQYLNNLKAKSDKSSSIYGIMNRETVRTDGRRIFVPPMPLDELRAAFKKELESVLVSIKAKNKVATRNVNKTRKKGGFNSKITLTPRGTLHLETVYGQRHKYKVTEVSIGSKMTPEVIGTVASKKEREALAARLAEFGGDPKKAFTGKNSPDKNPIWADSLHTRKLGDKVRCVTMETVYSVRKAVGPELNIDKVLDAGIKIILEKRLEEFGGDRRKAFSNLEDNPIWLDEKAGIQIKSVAIEENFDLIPLHGDKDYVNLKNNHHVAIYRRPDGKLEEKVVSFFEALDRIENGFKAVDRDYKKDQGYEFLFSMKINEMFVFPNPETGFDPNEIDLMDPSNYDRISPNLFRVQTLSQSDYRFRHHLEATLNNEKALQETTWKRITNLNKLEGVVKVRINHIGRIVAVGEYD